MYRKPFDKFLVERVQVLAKLLDATIFSKAKQIRINKRFFLYWFFKVVNLFTFSITASKTFSYERQKKNRKRKKFFSRQILNMKQ